MTNSQCPNFDTSFVTVGVCPIVTLTPTLTSSPTPTLSLSPTSTVTQTPTMTSSVTVTPTYTFNPCENFDATITVEVKATNTPTPSVTLQLTPTPFDVDIATFQIFDNPFDCGEVGVFEDCNSGEVYYIQLPITYQGNNIEEGAITVFVEGGDTEICMEFRDTEQASPSILITSVNSVSQTGCDGCSTSLEKIIPQITPSITQ